jgi:hypothetical protein
VKKNLGFVGMLVMVLALGVLFIGCENGTQEVEGAVSINKPQVAAPAISEVKTTDGKYVILSWNAVDGAGSYSVKKNQKNKTHIQDITYDCNPTNTITYKTDGSTERNNDPDKWNAKISLVVDFEVSTMVNHRYGVSATAGRYDGLEWYNSGITWGADYETVPHPYRALLGTWIKEGSSTGPKFVITETGNYNPIRYTLYAANGTTELNYDDFSASSPGAVSFSGYYYDGGGSNYFTATLQPNGKLDISGGTGIDGNYTRR